MKLTTIKIQKQKLERWKMIEGYSNYMVSSLGRVKSLNYGRTNKPGILKPGINSGGYLIVTLCKNGKMKSFRVHRLVAIAFIPNVDNKPEVNHIDENKQNNNVNNLEWVTSKENINYGTRNKKASKAMKGKYTGEKHPFYGKHHSEESKKKQSEARKGKYKGENSPVARKVRCIETGEIFTTLTEACEWCGLKSISDIAKQIQGKRKSAGKHPETGEKLTWEYVIEEINLDLNIISMSNINITY